MLIPAGMPAGADATSDYLAMAGRMKAEAESLFKVAEKGVNDSNFAAMVSANLSKSAQHTNFYSSAYSSFTAAAAFYDSARIYAYYAAVHINNGKVYDSQNALTLGTNAAKMGGGNFGNGWTAFTASSPTPQSTNQYTMATGNLPAKAVNCVDAYFGTLGGTHMYSTGSLPRYMYSCQFTGNRVNKCYADPRQSIDTKVYTHTTPLVVGGFEGRTVLPVFGWDEVAGQNLTTSGAATAGAYGVLGSFGAGTYTIVAASKYRKVHTCAKHPTNGNFYLWSYSVPAELQCRNLNVATALGIPYSWVTAWKAC
ncbi:MAG: hypothetical protein WBD02_02125 [Acidimicrobiia bacterium]